MGILLLDGKPVLTSSDGKLIEAPSGGSSEPAEEIEPGDITFYDYEGTVVAAWSLSELSSKTALPDGPTHEGLTFQGWNWSLADLKTQNTKMNVGAMYTTTDGKTRIYIHMEDERKSPILGVGVNGTVTVDWGDGSTPDTLTGTNLGTKLYTPIHNYANSGDYIITLTINGKISIIGGSANNKYRSYLLRATNSNTYDNRDQAYLNAIKKIEIGNNVVLNSNGFGYCISLESISIPESISFYSTRLFYWCMNLRALSIPNTVSIIEQYALYRCESLRVCAIPKSVTAISTYGLYGCNVMRYLYLSNNITSLVGWALQGCGALTSLVIPSAVTSLSAVLCSGCYSLSKVIVKGAITQIFGNTFNDCYSVKLYDFSNCTAVPALASNTFSNMPIDCEIRVPASLLDEWKAATNWSTYADHIVAAS